MQSDYIEEFVRKHENMVFRTAIAIMGNKAEAEDIMQDVFLKALEKAPLFQSAEHEIAWLKRVTINHCRSRLRSFWWKKTEPLSDLFPAINEEQQVLMETVKSLPVKYRIAICLFYYDGYSIKEIAEITNQKENTVKSHLARARMELKNYLEGEME